MSRTVTPVSARGEQVLDQLKDVAAQLRAAREIVRVQDQRRDELMAEAVEARLTWAQIGQALGITAQSAHGRYWQKRHREAGAY